MDIDDKRIEACFSDSRPQFSQPDFKLVHDPGIYLFECINFLAKLNKECVQHFIDLLMERITPNEPNQDNQPKSCRLIIEITTEESTDKFNLRAWVKGSLDDGPLLDPQHSLDSNQASKKLEECVKKLANPPFGVKDVEIEFFLPVNLLSFYAADQLPFAELEGSDPLPIGYYHRVNVRILDIAWRDRKHGGTDAHTEGRWNKLHSSKTSKPCCCVKIPDAYQQNQLFAFLINDENKREEVLKKLIKHKEAIVCGVLSFAPSPMKNLEQACVINYLIARGVRVILWPRGTCKIKKGSLSNTLRKLVELDTLNQLSFNILKLRMDAVDKKKQNPRHVGSHLTLVWDDPTRPHPDNELQLRDSASSPADYSGERND